MHLTVAWVMVSFSFSSLFRNKVRANSFPSALHATVAVPPLLRVRILLAHLIAPNIDQNVVYSIPILQKSLEDIVVIPLVSRLSIFWMCSESLLFKQYWLCGLSTRLKAAKWLNHGELLVFDGLLVSHISPSVRPVPVLTQDWLGGALLTLRNCRTMTFCV
jgi:hypothetical protein